MLLDSVQQLPAALHTVLRPDVEATGKTAGLGFIHRSLAESDIYFVTNTGNEPIDGNVRFRAHRSYMETWDPDSGQVVSSGNHADMDRVPLALAPYQSIVFVLTDRPSLGPSLNGKGPGMNAAPDEPKASSAQQTVDLSSGWQIRFADSTTSQPLTSLTSWTELAGRQFYSGEASYTRSFELASAPKRDTRVLIDFGPGTPTVDSRPPGSNGTHALLDPPIREAAIIYVNGKRVGSLWHPPYRIDISKFVRHGQNRIEVRVYNTAINLLAGQPPRDYSALYAKYGKRFEPQDMDNLKPVPSGLIGNVSLVEEPAD
jgi:hypothetical protein